MSKLLVEFQRPPSEIGYVVEAAIMPKVRAALDDLAHGLEQSFAPITGTGDDQPAERNLNAGFRRARRMLVAELVAWLEDEFHDLDVEIIIVGYDPDGDLRKE